MTVINAANGTSYKPHIPKSDNYLHYYAINVQSWVFSQALIDESPIEILEEAKHKISNVRAKQQQQIQAWAASGALSLEEAADIEYLLMRSDWLENFEPATTIGGSLNFPDIDIDKAEGAIQDAIDTLVTNGESLKQIEDALERHIPNLSEEMTKAYADLLEKYFLGKAFTTRVPMSGLRSEAKTGWQQRALEAILSRQNQAFFSSGGNYKNTDQFKFSEWTADKAKLLTALNLLHDPQLPTYIQNLGDKGVTISHGNGDQYFTKDTAEILKAFFDKIKNYYNQMDAIGLEASAGQGVINAYRKIGKEIEPVHEAIKNFSGAGNVETTVDFSKTKAFFDAVNKKAYSNATRRAKKSDNATISISQGEDDAKVTVTQGITIKKDRKLNFDPNYPSPANFTLQRGTPLLTLLAREAGLNSSQLFSIVQLLAAHGSNSEYNDALVNQWNAAKQVVKYKAFLATLAGFTNELADSAFYMLINDHLYDIITIIDSLKETTQNYVNWMVDSKSVEGSLEYEDYNALNEWHGKETADSEDAETRSDTAFKAINTKLYNTKIRITLHISELAALVALNK